MKAAGDKIGPWETFQIDILDQPLQGAIDAVGPGGTVRLEEGVYRGRINTEKSVNIIGAGSGRTVVDGDNKGTVITIHRYNSDVDVKLIGVAIRGGLDGHGGGIYNQGHLTIEDAAIIGNNATYSGGGVYNFEGSLDIVNSRIVMNRAAHQGGGIFNYEGTANINNSTIQNNTAYYDGGILSHLGAITLSASDIEDNMALGLSSTDPLGEGGGVWSFSTFDFKGGCVKNNQPDDVYHVYHKPEIHTPS